VSVIKRRPTPAVVAAMVGSGVLVVLGAAKAAQDGDNWIWISILIGPPISAFSIWLTKRKMAQGRTPEEIIGWWFTLPIIGRWFRFSDRVNHRMGHGSEDLLADARRSDPGPRKPPPPGDPTPD
jgi:hypothetical protein